MYFDGTSRIVLSNAILDAALDVLKASFRSLRAQRNLSWKAVQRYSNQMLFQVGNDTLCLVSSFIFSYLILPWHSASTYVRFICLRSTNLTVPINSVINSFYFCSELPSMGFMMTWYDTYIRNWSQRMKPYSATLSHHFPFWTRRMWLREHDS